MKEILQQYNIESVTLVIILTWVYNEKQQIEQKEIKCIF